MLLSTAFYSESVAVGLNSEYAGQLPWCYFLVASLVPEHKHSANELAETIQSFCLHSI
jgi:hypothetical protein